MNPNEAMPAPTKTDIILNTRRAKGHRGSGRRGCLVRSCGAWPRLARAWTPQSALWGPPLGSFLGGGSGEQALSSGNGRGRGGRAGTHSSLPLPITPPPPLAGDRQVEPSWWFRKGGLAFGNCAMTKSAFGGFTSPHLLLSPPPKKHSIPPVSRRSLMRCKRGVRCKVKLLGFSEEGTAGSSEGRWGHSAPQWGGVGFIVHYDDRGAPKGRGVSASASQNRDPMISELRCGKWSPLLHTATAGASGGPRLPTMVWLRFSMSMRNAPLFFSSAGGRARRREAPGILLTTWPQLFNLRNLERHFLAV